MPCVGNERVQGAIDTFGKAGKLDKFPIYNANRVEAKFTIVIVRNDKGELTSSCHKNLRVERQISHEADSRGVSQEMVY